MAGRLEGKIIFVAGGGGIGDELARHYAREGARIVLGDIDGKSAGEVADAIVTSGGQALGLTLDGSDEGSVNAAVARTIERFGAIDGLHANFASFEDGKRNVDAIELPMDVYDAEMAVNARGFLLCTRAVVPELVKRGGGAIVYTSSNEAILPYAVRSAYSMSKSAGHALMRHIAFKYGADNIRANSIAPGVIIHPRLATSAGPDFEENAKRASAIKTRVGNPNDVAALGALLLSEDGSYITGQVISVDGGTSMRP